MEVSNCRSCGRLFNVITNSKICPSCKQKQEDKFQKVKEYLRENPNASINVISLECDVSVKQIKEWVREERLIFAEGSADGVECTQCGKLIRTGKYCDECKSKLANTLRSGINVDPTPVRNKRGSDRDRMRFL